MNCADQEIKELLPLYLEQELDEAGRDRVRKHLAACADCRLELSLLRSLSEERVPDPGAAFWATMPDRVMREVRDRRQKKISPFLGAAGAWLAPRWGRAAAAFCVLAATAFWFVQQGPVNLRPPVRESASELAADRRGSGEEYFTREGEADVRLAQSDLAPMGDAVDEEVFGEHAHQLSDDLSRLNARELDRFLEMLERQEQAVRERVRGRMKQQNETG